MKTLMGILDEYQQAAKRALRLPPNMKPEEMSADQLAAYYREAFTTLADDYHGLLKDQERGRDDPLAATTGPIPLNVENAKPWLRVLLADNAWEITETSVADIRALSQGRFQGENVVVALRTAGLSIQLPPTPTTRQRRTMRQEDAPWGEEP